MKIRGRRGHAVTPCDAMTEEQLNKARPMMLSAAREKELPACRHAAGCDKTDNHWDVCVSNECHCVCVCVCSHQSHLNHQQHPGCLRSVTAITITILSPGFVFVSVNLNPRVIRGDATRPCGMSDLCLQSGEIRAIILRYCFLSVSVTI